MRINMNTALQVSRQMVQTSAAISRSLERLSSGNRVNEAKDDPAAINQISTLDSAIRGTKQASRNLNDTLGVLQTADTAISSQLEIVQKIRELAVQASNGTLQTADRTALNMQVNQLLTEFNRITTDTEFNGTKLLDGSFGTRSMQVGAGSNNQYNVSVGNLTASSIFTKTVGSGQFTNRTTFNSAATGDLLAVDLDQDGNQDYVANYSAGNYISVRMGKGDGTFYESGTFSTGASPYGITAGDLNNDGLTDLVLGTDSIGGYTTVLLGNGKGTFKAPTTLATSMRLYSTTIADFNRDGKADIATAGYMEGYVSLFFGNGDGTFQARQTLSGTSPYHMAAVDFNGDGATDIGFTNGSTNFSVYLNNGNGTFGSVANYTTGNSNTGVDTGDFDGDGDLDVAVASPTASAISVILNNGNGTFGTNTNYSAGTPTRVRARDINGDGILDLVSNDSAGNLSYLQGTGSGTFATRVTSSSAITSGSIDFADFNNDGVLDFIGSDSSSTTSYYTARTLTRAAANDVSVATQVKALGLLKIADTAITNLKTEQASIGRLLRRVESTSDSNDTFSESYQSAKDVVQSTDVAMETAELTRNQILQQAQVASLAQANTSAQVALGLLKNL